jgi:hypothetical protein
MAKGPPEVLRDLKKHGLAQYAEFVIDQLEPAARLISYDTAAGAAMGESKLGPSFDAKIPWHLRGSYQPAPEFKPDSELPVLLVRVMTIRSAAIHALSDAAWRIHEGADVLLGCSTGDRGGVSPAHGRRIRNAERHATGLPPRVSCHRLSAQSRRRTCSETASIPAIDRRSEATVALARRLRQ